MEINGKNISQAIERVNQLARLKDDWDGYGASRVLPAVISNIRKVLLVSKVDDWRDWTISPNVNGTLFLQSTKHISSLSLGENEYSYFSKTDAHREGKSHLAFRVNDFLTMMRTLNVISLCALNS